jgi:hypothetical protein
VVEPSEATVHPHARRGLGALQPRGDLRVAQLRDHQQLDGVALGSAHLLERSGERRAVALAVRQRLDPRDRFLVERGNREPQPPDRAK